MFRLFCFFVFFPACFLPLSKCSYFSHYLNFKTFCVQKSPLSKAKNEPLSARSWCGSQGFCFFTVLNFSFNELQMSSSLPECFILAGSCFNFYRTVTPIDSASLRMAKSSGIYLTFIGSCKLKNLILFTVSTSLESYHYFML